MIGGQPQVTSGPSEPPSKPEGADLLRVENLTKAFSGVEVLKNLTLGIRPGEILGVIGENGAGKSTFMKLISGVYSPTSGRILFDGQPVRVPLATGQWLRNPAGVWHTADLAPGTVATCLFVTSGLGTIYRSR